MRELRGLPGFPSRKLRLLGVQWNYETSLLVPEFRLPHAPLARLPRAPARTINKEEMRRASSVVAPTILLFFPHLLDRVLTTSVPQRACLPTVSAKAPFGKFYTFLLLPARASAVVANWIRKRWSDEFSSQGLPKSKQANLGSPQNLDTRPPPSYRPPHNPVANNGRKLHVRNVEERKLANILVSILLLAFEMLFFTIRPLFRPLPLVRKRWVKWRGDDKKLMSHEAPLEKFQSARSKRPFLPHSADCFLPRDFAPTLP
ncbi:hypothetical protein BDK51DRAFT_32474 [Blyttiomyces helicus]|uniref:Uncharacterized protein n=1 Tax=Blyttiomyces helicus TaxID=388810 RepID=A0A4P9W2E7_9FUNG|nr:hypothetical protein BDK51DRAFT_32474 [Blyttiomyces helicus]|eukprot:RKO86391.1 hypothetical protein BDK51DRAFT_32474 [Blyttiomyces helicus]